jgi:hypothetical protein
MYAKKVSEIQICKINTTTCVSVIFPAIIYIALFMLFFLVDTRLNGLGDFVLFRGGAARLKKKFHRNAKYFA